MTTASRSATTDYRPSTPAWLPLVVLPALTLWAGRSWAPWIWMWVLAFSIYAGLKWLTYAQCDIARRASRNRSLAYLLLWPGMDARRFLDKAKPASRPKAAEWFWAVVKLVCGLLTVWATLRLVSTGPELVVAWIGMIGIVLALHFGLFHLFSLLWRRAGMEAPPIMNAPILAHSLSDFWGRRWNRAFRDLSHRFVYGSLHTRIGVAGATLAVFFVSGLIHDLVISVPARGGWGMPTAYFLLQALGLFAERSRVGKRLGLRRGCVGRIFAAAVVVIPLPLVFHPPFLERVVLPMLSAWGTAL